MLFPFVFIVNVCSTLLCTFFVCLSCAVVSVRSVRFGREPPAASPPTAGCGRMDVVDYIFRDVLSMRHHRGVTAYMFDNEAAGCVDLSCKGSLAPQIIMNLCGNLDGACIEHGRN